jgi:threonine synthase
MAKSRILSVGKTPLVPMLGYEDVFIKREECEPFGTHKDLLNEVGIKYACRKGAHHVVCITAGNRGFSLARLAEGTGIQVSCIVDTTTDPFIIAQLRLAGAGVHVEDLSQGLSSEEIIDCCRTRRKEMIIDVTHGFERRAYAPIIKKIRHVRPRSVLFPIGDGGLGIGLHHGLEDFDLDAQLWGVMVSSRESIADKLRPGPSTNRRTIKELLRDGHRLITLKEEDVRRGMELVPKGIAAEPSSAVVYAVLEKYRKQLGRTVVINTGSCLTA